MNIALRMAFGAACAALLPALAVAPHGLSEVAGDVAAEFECEVSRRLEVPETEREDYARRLRAALDAAGLRELAPQHFLLVDRSPRVQAAFVYRLTPGGELRFTGAAPVSTGRPGSFEHFATPLGVFAHTLDNPDFRAEGTVNENGIRGYGRAGRRVFDFGWVRAPRGWGNQAEGEMRLQVHATDPDVLERFLGDARSKGCIRIPAALDEFLDRRGILDADYEAAALDKRAAWVLRADRETTRWPGRYLVVVDSERGGRPAWSPVPGRGAGPAPARTCPEPPPRS